MDITEIDKKLQNSFAINKINVEKIAYDNKLKAQNNPIFVKLNSLEKDIIFEIGKESSKENFDLEKIKNLEKELTLVKQNKEKILKKLNLTESDLNPKYKCEICKDTGFVHSVMCSCYKKQRNLEIVKQCGIDEKEFVSFDDFNEKLFIDENHIEHFNKLKSLLKKWCDSYPNIKKTNIILSGPTGVGKSFLTKCMAKSLLEKELSVIFLSAFELNNIFLKYHTSFDNKKDQLLLPLIDTDVIFIDDLGSEPVLKNVTINYLYLLLSERERFKRPTIISTNLSPDLIATRYDERIFSRLSNKQISININLQGEDLRTKK